MRCQTPQYTQQVTDKLRITSICLILLHLKTPDPYLAHLSGINNPPQLLPFTLPYKPTNKPMFSEMSFKCRSSTSFASSAYTLTDPNSDPLYTLYPTRPDKAYGLGIYAPKKSISSSSNSSFSTAASFLTPRLSLKSLRSQASLAGPRPLHLHSKSYPTTSSAHSPLPPVPTYNPEKYKNFPPLHLHGKKSSSSDPAPPPQRAYTLKRRVSQGTLRVVLRSPSCPLMLGDHHGKIIDTDNVKKQDSKPNNAILLINTPLARTLSLGAEFISSVYSRSLSGEDPEPTKTATPRFTIPATTTITTREQQQHPHHRQTSSFNLRTSSMSPQPPPHTKQPPYRHYRPTSRPVSGPRPQSAARPPPIRYHNPHNSYQPANNDNANNRILVRNHFPGPGHHHNHQRNKKTASAEEIRTRNRSSGNGRLPSTRAVSGFGDVREWSGGGVVSGEMMVGGASQGHRRGDWHVRRYDSSWAARCGLPPLPVERGEVRFREVLFN